VADLDDAPAIQHDDGVGAARSSTGDCAITNEVRFIIRFASASLHQQLRLGIERRGRLVEHQNRRVLQNRRAIANPLALSARQPLTALADRGVVSRRAAPR
jgi:hypothetical protein